MNDKIKITEEKLLSDNWYILKKITFNYLSSKGKWHTASRESYDKGNGVSVLLYNKEKQTVILTRQFRMPTFLNGNSDGMMIETCAGVLDVQDPDECIKREILEETGFKITKVERVLDVYMSPGAVTEKLFLYVAEYQSSDKVNAGGGLEHENEDIEVMEMPFEKAWEMMKSGEIKDGKTLMLFLYARSHSLL